MNSKNINILQMKKALLECGFIITNDKTIERDTLVDISKKDRPELKEKLRKIIDIE